MPPGGGASRAWLRAAFALDGKAGATGNLSSVATSLPPAFLCPSEHRHCIQSVSSATRRRLVTRRAEQQPWALCKQGQRRRFGDAAAAAVAPAARHVEPPELGTEPTSTETENTTTPDERDEPDEREPTRKPKKLPKPKKKVGAVDLKKATRRLPLQCPGCGAFSQTMSETEPGFFDLTRTSTLEYLGLAEPKKQVREERQREQDRIVQEALQRLQAETGEAEDRREDRHEAQVDEGKNVAADTRTAKDTAARDKASEILCVRCHDLLHHNSGTSIFHPGMDSICETIEESPYKYNHVYHVLDAADFPMSLLPRIQELLSTMPLRSRNRRAQHAKFYGGRRTELSFVVARADLLAARKDQVDKLLPWARETLRAALGRLGRDVRLGNVHLVSGRANWWTQKLREEIYHNGGGNWLVGKANVGKSYLVSHIFPKGRMDEADKHRKPIVVKKNAPDLLEMKLSQSGRYDLDLDQTGLPRDADEQARHARHAKEVEMDLEAERLARLHVDRMLPPRPTETNYPQMPVVSALPGTTASPIRIPFGGGKGELIDLPGLERTSLIDHVRDERKDDLVMKLRCTPEQVVLKGHWDSLLIGGMIRITPKTPNLTFLTYNFTPLKEHRTSTEKAKNISAQASDLNVDSIAAPGTGDKMQHAGSFQLKHDVTKLRAGPITRKDAANISVDRLPYRVLAMDLLIEGCGWVEIVAQVRTRQLYREDERRALEEQRANAQPLETLDLSPPDFSPPDEPDEPVDAFEAAFGLANRSNSITKSKRSKYIRPPAETPAPGPAAQSDPGEIRLEPDWPEIDVFSPEGKFIASRQPLNAWMMQPKKAPPRRPRKSMKGHKKAMKAAARARASS